jgi:phospholipase C
MQENHSFDNYLGALAYAPGSPYRNGNGSCSSTDHKCVDGLTCTVAGNGSLNCSNTLFMASAGACFLTLTMVGWALTLK